MHNALKLLALLTFACGSNATAAPSKPAAPTAPACSPTGDVLFEADHRVDPGAKAATWTVKVFTNGAWTRSEIDAQGKPAAPRAGCFTPSDLKLLQTTLSGAAWKVTTSEIHCMAFSAESTVFHVNGKQVYTQRLCSGDSLDDKSRAKLDVASAQVDSEIAKTPPKP